MSAVAETFVPEREVETLAERMGESTAGYEILDPDVDAAPVDKAVNRTFEVLGAAVLGAVALLTFANALGRYLLNMPLPWTEEVVLILMPWITMIGLLLSVRRRGLIRIDSYVEAMPPRVARAVELATEYAAVLLFGYVAWVGLEYLMMFGGDPTNYFGIAKGFYTSAFCVGFFLVALSFVAEIWRSFKR